MLFEKLLQGPTGRSKNLEFLKKTDYPVVVIGIAQAAKWTTALLVENGIGIDAYCVTDDYWRSYLKFEGKPVESLSGILRKFDKLVMILAVGSGRKELRNKLAAYKQVSACLEFDCPTVAEIFDAEQMIPHRESLEKLYSNLSDDFSRQTMAAFLNTRISGDINFLQGLELPEKEQYFPDFIAFSKQETVVDCGAYTGDTLEMFLQKIGSMKRYFAFECDPINFQKIHEKFNGQNNIVLLPYGAFDSECIAHMDFEGGYDSRISPEGKIAVKLATIDRIMDEYKSDCTYIKMDIEGAELAALRGAEQTIRRCRPKLAICVYHKAEDLWTIPQYILSLNPDYKFYLRKYAMPFSCELVLYAI